MVLVLPLDFITKIHKLHAGITHQFDPQPCHRIDTVTGGVTWQAGYEDGGSLELQRQFPARVVNNSRTSDDVNGDSFCWVHVRELEEFDPTRSSIDRSTFEFDPNSKVLPHIGQKENNQWNNGMFHLESGTIHLSNHHV